MCTAKRYHEQTFDFLLASNFCLKNELPELEQATFVHIETCIPIHNLMSEQIEEYMDSGYSRILAQHGL